MDDADRVPEPRSPGIRFGILVEGGLILVALGLGWLLGQPPLETFRLDVGDALLGIVATAPMLLVFWATLRLNWSPINKIRQFFDDVVRPLFAGGTVLDLALIAILAGLGEEMLFRGVLQAVFAEHLGPWIALALASLVFGLLHAITPTYALLATLIGAYLGGLWLLSGNLLVPIVVHALYDLIALVWLLRVEARAQPEVEEAA